MKMNKEQVAADLSRLVEIGVVAYDAALRAGAAPETEIPGEDEELLKSKYAALLVGIVADLCADADAFRQMIQAACDKERKLLEWFRLDVSATGEGVKICLLPTERFFKLMGAASAAELPKGGA